MSTKIQWTDRVWNPVTGCTKVSQGCKNCYAETIANRKLPHGGFTDRPFTTVRTHEDRLTQPLKWRKPSRVFVNSMSDLFHEAAPFEFIDKVFAIMALAPRHTFQILTKRPERMREYLTHPDVGQRIAEDAMLWKHKGSFDGAEAEPDWTAEDAENYIAAWPLPNVWLGTSVENQETADERIPLLRATPAAVRFISYEPALSVVDFSKHLHVTWVYSAGDGQPHPANDGRGGWWTDLGVRSSEGELPRPDWIIVGGESGHHARQFDIEWARVVIAQGAAAGIRVFVKQLGANPLDSRAHIRDLADALAATGAFLKASKGDDPFEWPPDLRVREFPA